MTEDITQDSRFGPLGLCCDCLTDDHATTNAVTMMQGNSLCAKHAQQRDANRTEMLRKASGGR